MAGLIGFMTSAALADFINPNLSSDLLGFEPDLYDPRGYDNGTGIAPPPTTVRRVARGLGRGRQGVAVQTFFEDFYFRIYVSPSPVELGGLVTTQVRQLHIWNAWPYQPRTLVGADLANGEGITMTLPGALPITFRPLAEHVIELQVSTSGPPVIDATLTLGWADLADIVVEISGQRLQAWPVMADWGRPVVESLEWLTEIQQAMDGSEDAVPLREAPRRGWSFEVLEGRQERRIIENAVYDWGARVWALPVFPDVSLLAAELPAESTAIALDPAGLDFRAGGLAMLWADALSYELVEIASVEADRLELARPTLQGWPRGTRLYPCRTAHLRTRPTWRRRSDQVVSSRMEFAAAEPCDWPAEAPPVTYRGIPVLEWRPDESEDPTAQADRQLEAIDGDIGLVVFDDVTGRPWELQSHDFLLRGRGDRAGHRSLMYWLQGRYQRVWLPTWADDVQLLDPVAAGAVTWFVANAGITSYLRQQDGRRHLRVELNTGQVFYREVLASSVADSARETLLVDAALGVAVTPGQVRQISWMKVSRLAADRVEITHPADSHGVARSRVRFVQAGVAEP